MSTESILQRHDKSVKFKPMHQRERGLTENVVRNRKLPMMSRTQRDCREVRGLLAQPSRPYGVRVCGFDQNRSWRTPTHHASQGSNPGQIIRTPVCIAPGGGP